MARKSQGKRSSNRAAQKASAGRHNEEALKAVFSGTKTFVFGVVEAERGFAQFAVRIAKDITVMATPLGVFTKGSCPIAAGQVVLMEPTTKAGQVHQIIARVDKKKDVKELIKAKLMSEELLQGNEDGTVGDLDLFDYDDKGEEAEEDEVDVDKI